MDSNVKQPTGGVISQEGHYQQMIKDQNKQIYDLYKRVEQLAKEKSELRREVERLSKFNKFE
jgi:predicted RNase H-like nuclease (RuvC/YqgF family)